MAVRIVKVLPGLELELHFCRSYHSRYHQGSGARCFRIAQAITEDDVFVTGAILEGERNRLWLVFYCHQGRFVCEYCFVRSELLSFLQDASWIAGLKYTGYNLEFLDKLKRFEKAQRTW
jgi:hypothetical protein